MSTKNEPIAVVGVSALFPGSIDKDGFWKDILAGTDRMTDVPASHWLIEDYYDADPTKPDKTYAKRGAFIPDVDFDPVEWGIPPSLAPATDTAQLLALIVAKQVLNDASENQFQNVPRDRLSCILGVTSAQELLASMVSRLQRPVWVKALREEGLPEDEVQKICDRIVSNYAGWQEATFPGLLGNVVAGRIANRLDIGGTNCVTDAACASSFSALSMAVNELVLGQSDIVIAGGADTMNDIFMYMCFSKTPALSASGDCRPFSDKADGTMLGEGFGMVALKRLSDAERDGDRVYAVIKAVGSSSDGRDKSVYAPVSAGQAKALRRAYERAGHGPETVELVEAHGTGTRAGDAAEFGGLRMVFEESGRTDRQWCQLGSVKSQIGHTKASAGAAGLVKAILALHHKVLPPTIKVDRPDPKLNIEESPFQLTTRARPWARGKDHPRRASVSSFGFGGSNFHVVLEEYSGAAKRAYRSRTTETELVILTGANAGEVQAKASELAKASAAHPGMLRFLARDTQESFDANRPARLAVVASSDADLAEKLGKAAELVAKGEAFTNPQGIYFEAGGTPGEVAFLFPGQGSQSLDMGNVLAMTYPQAIAAWDLAASIELAKDVTLHEVVFPKTAFTEEGKKAQDDRLRATEWAQPGIGVASLALLNVVRDLGIAPSCVGGHSFGEVTALHAAGVLSAEDLVKVARKRGELMRDAAASAPGSMTAVSATIEKLQPLLAQWGLDVVVANHNSPEQVVLSGTTDAIAAVEGKLEEAGLTAKRLNVATAFHSKIVASSTVPFGGFLADVSFGAPSCDVYANATAAPYPAEAGAMRAMLAEQIASPVRFVEQIEAMYARGVRTFVEVGPGSVLTGLVGRILKGRAHRAVALDRAGRDSVTSLHHGLAQLAVAGVPMTLGNLFAPFERREDPRTSKKPKMTLRLNGANYGKPYPPKGGAAALPKPNPARPKTAAPAPSSTTELRAATPAKSAAPVSAPAPVGAKPAAPVATPAPAPVAQPAPVATPAPAPVAQPAQVVVAPALPSNAWLEAYQLAQLQTAQAHSAYQKAMADTHAAFLRSAEASIFGLTTLAQGGLGAIVAAQPVVAQPVAIPAPVAPPAYVAPVAPPAPVVAKPVAQAPAPVAAKPAAPAPVAAKPAAPAPVAAKPAAPGIDLEKLMMEVVAEKTGYPVEMLGLAMDLEADLGVDSIKRVEILSSMREKAPSLPDVDAGEMAKLRTLGQIVDYMRSKMPAGSASVSAAAPAPVAAKPAAPGIDLEKLMMEVVAEKTGYPVEMLGLAMDLEADLGVDSIKRVEILSSMREKAPSLPDVDAGEMAKLRTLGQIVDYMRSKMPAGSASVSAAAPAPVAAKPAAPGIDLEKLMMEVVAEKTGYPVEMLGLAMDLEADLGVDSIKRVEILSSMREKAPSLPDVDAGEMAKLRTLGQIVDYMRSRMPAGASAPAVAVAAAPVASAPGVDLEKLMMEVVAEKTGYPTDMLGLAMDLEADLGVDSIKRVEILSSMREKAPSLPDVDAGEMAKLRTLGQIVDYMRSRMPAGASAAAVAVAAAPVASAPGVDLEKLMMEVVAEKTGYPTDMLGLAMDLEADLGVDSIKRVEILSSMREKAPSLPDVDAGEMAKLRTLGQIVDYMRSRMPAGASAPAVAVAAAPVASAPGIDLEALMMEVVAEKTGYPTDMLGLAMDLEADLGVDSIKRVEILSSMREKAPSLPDVDAGEMAKLRTLGQIVEYMRSRMPAGASTASAVAKSTPVATPAAGPSSSPDRADVGRYPLRLRHAPAQGFAITGLATARRLVVTDEGTGIAGELVARLRGRGLSAEVVGEVPADADAVVFLGGLREVADVDSAVWVNKEAFRAAKAVAGKLSTEGGAFVTVQDTGGDFGLSGSARAWLGGLPGLVKTAMQEWPKAGLRAIDLERAGRSAGEVADVLAAELLAGGHEVEVALRASGERLTLESFREEAVAAPSVVDERSVIVASGGARGVTAETLVELASRTKCRVVLLGRTALEDEPASCRGLATDAELKKALLADAKASGAPVTPAQLGAKVATILANREVRGTVDRIRSAGGDARYIIGDVQDADAVRAALAEVRREWGPITGIVHGAGILADKFLVDKTVEQFERVFDTKVNGLRVLLGATREDPIDTIVMFSSVAARCGNQGQVDYAMANEVLNKVAAAERARRGDVVVKSLNWGPWEGGMVTPQLKARFESLGVPLIPLRQGARMMAEELTRARVDQIELVLGGEPKPEALLSDGSEGPTRFEIFVDAKSHPYLDGHRVKGVPVVPVVLALEWFARAARACRPDLAFAGLKDVKVLKGITLPRFDEGGDRFVVSASKVSNGRGATYAMVLEGPNGQRHYAATAQLEVELSGRSGSLPSLSGLSAWNAPVYGDVLFHGESFQVIRDLEGVSREGVSAQLVGTEGKGWTGEGWQTDPALLDGGLQLALLWTQHTLGGASLPTAVSGLRVYREGLPSGVQRAILKAREAKGDRGLCDIVFLGPEGEPVAELVGVETHVLPGTRTASN